MLRTHEGHKKEPGSWSHVSCDVSDGFDPLAFIFKIVAKGIYDVWTSKKSSLKIPYAAETLSLCTQLCNSHGFLDISYLYKKRGETKAKVIRYR